jgi:hypothetical protein
MTGPVLAAPEPGYFFTLKITLACACAAISIR